MAIRRRVLCLIAEFLADPSKVPQRRLNVFDNLLGENILLSQSRPLSGYVEAVFRRTDPAQLGPGR